MRHLCCVCLITVFPSVCVVGDGVLWSRLCDRLGEEDEGELPERGLDRLYLQRGSEGKINGTQTV